MRCSIRAIACLFVLASLEIASADSPNIVLVLADDLGYGDLGCFGSAMAKTPQLDRFASEGMKFTSCYAGHGNCSPSRTALMTGRTPMRVGIRSAIPLGSPMHVGRNEITIARLLSQAGYETCHVGKWHMNGMFNHPSQPQPNDHGFGYWFSTQNNALPNHRQPNNFARNGAVVGKTEGYASQVVIDEAEKWLKEIRDPSKPFFLYVCFHEPHEPIATDPKYASLFPSDDPSYSAFYGNISQMDDAFGRLMKILDSSGLRDETLVFFTSDNGPAITSQHPHGSAGPLRGKKGMLWEGGIRVPGIVRWPKKIAAGSTSDVPIGGVDFLPTVCDMAGIEPPGDRKIDGTSWLPLLEGKKLTRSEPLYWHFPRAAEAPKVAMRIGDWKILATFDSAHETHGNHLDEISERNVKAAALDQFYLFNIQADIGETQELSASEPDKLAEMKPDLIRKYHEVRHETPLWPHFINENAEGKLIEWPDYVKQKPANSKGKVKK